MGGKTVVPVPTIRPGRPSPRSRTARLARLPDVFTWREVAEVWEVPKRTAFKRIKNLLAEGAIEKLGHGRYEVFAVETAESAESAESAASAKRRERRESAESAESAPQNNEKTGRKCRKCRNCKTARTS